MDKKKLWASIRYISLTAVLVLIVTCCVVFSKPKTSDEDTPKQPDIIESTNFGFEDNITLLLGDEFDLSPQYNADNSLKYITEDECVCVSDAGLLTTNKVGVAKVVVQNHNMTVKTVNISILPNYTISSNDNCEILNNNIVCYDDNFSIMIDLKNSKEQIVFGDVVPEIYTQDNIKTFTKFGRLYISSTTSGSLHVNYPSLNFSIELEVEFK